MDLRGADLVRVAAVSIRRRGSQQESVWAGLLSPAHIGA